MTSTPKDFNKARASFMRRASAPHVSPFALKLAYLIAFKHMDSKTRTARPSQETLARDLNIEERSVRRLLDVLQPLGLVIVPGNGRGRAATYWIDPDKATTERRTPESCVDGSRVARAL